VAQLGRSWTLRGQHVETRVACIRYRGPASRAAWSAHRLPDSSYVRTATRSLHSHRVRSVDEVSHVAEHGKHFERCVLIRLGPPGVRYEVAHPHEGAPGSMRQHRHVPTWRGTGGIGRGRPAYHLSVSDTSPVHVLCAWTPTASARRGSADLAGGQRRGEHRSGDLGSWPHLMTTSGCSRSRAICAHRLFPGHRWPVGRCPRSQASVGRFMARGRAFPSRRCARAFRARGGPQ
jgi:hypothetical protein